LREDRERENGRRRRRMRGRMNMCICWKMKMPMNDSYGICTMEKKETGRDPIESTVKRCTSHPHPALFLASHDRRCISPLFHPSTYLSTQTL
jgi:hypothetical protein